MGAGNFIMLQVGLCESSFLRLEYSVELHIEYSSTRLILVAAVNYRVVQNKQISGFSFKFVTQNMSQHNAKLL